MHHWGSLTGLFWIVSGPTLATYPYLRTSRLIIVCYELITLYLVCFGSPSLTYPPYKMMEAQYQGITLEN